ncbi:MAG TPA: SDR family NAD(P)-dependent oxidoreductase [Gemmataceae bacterium]|nr:SDR family NAD(P)-dependent oxidoreductase [Gemmataceae bacterium]
MKRILRGRRLLITGASSGIGRCLAEQAASRGARLALVARSGEVLQELARKLTASGAHAVAIPADLTLEGDRQRLVRTAVERLGGLDVLINNAGVGSWAHFADSSEEILRQIMEVNFFAPAELIRLAIPHLTAGQQPAIVNLASMCGRRGMPAWTEYSASKFALCGLTEALRGEMVRFGIDVLLVLPGLTGSSMSRHLLLNRGKEKIDFRAGMDPAKVAGGVLRALEQNRAETVVGRDARWMLLANTLAPRLVDKLIARRVRKLYAGRPGT